jgi:acetyl esterase
MPWSKAESRTLFLRVLALPPEARGFVIRSLTRPQQREFNERWWQWAHDGQKKPEGDWRIWVIRARRGFGKTRAGAEWVSEIARTNPECRIALVGGSIDDARRVMIEGPGGLLTLRIYTPKGAGPFPLMVFFHGSGFVLCSLDTHDGMCRNLAAGIGCVVVSVDYRLAPEHKFPAGPDDCLAATRWAAAHAAELGVDPARILLAGDSAGGNMAAVTALRVRDEGGPALVGQMLLYPVTDYHTPGTPSYAENAEGYGLTRDTMESFWAH